MVFIRTFIKAWQIRFTCILNHNAFEPHIVFHLFISFPRPINLGPTTRRRKESGVPSHRDEARHALWKKGSGVSHDIHVCCEVSPNTFE